MLTRGGTAQSEGPNAADHAAGELEMQLCLDSTKLGSWGGSQEPATRREARKRTELRALRYRLLCSC